MCETQSFDLVYRRASHWAFHCSKIISLHQYKSHVNRTHRFCALAWRSSIMSAFDRQPLPPSVHVLHALVADTHYFGVMILRVCLGQHSRHLLPTTSGLSIRFADCIVDGDHTNLQSHTASIRLLAHSTHEHTDTCHRYHPYCVPPLVRAAVLHLFTKEKIYDLPKWPHIHT